MLRRELATLEAVGTQVVVLAQATLESVADEVSLITARTFDTYVNV